MHNLSGAKFKALKNPKFNLIDNPKEMTIDPNLASRQEGENLSCMHPELEKANCVFVAVGTKLHGSP